MGQKTVFGNLTQAFTSVKDFLEYCDTMNKENRIKYAVGLTDWIYIPGNFTETYNYFSVLKDMAIYGECLYNLF